jgi:hypothetical protein
VVFQDIPRAAPPEQVVVGRHSIVGLDRNLMTSHFFIQRFFNILVPAGDPVKSFILSVIKIEPGGETKDLFLLHQCKRVIRKDSVSIEEGRGRQFLSLQTAENFQEFRHDHLEHPLIPEEIDIEKPTLAADGLKKAGMFETQFHCSESSHGNPSEPSDVEDSIPIRGRTLQISEHFEKIGFMPSQGSRFHQKEREKRIMESFPRLETIARFRFLCFREELLSFILIRIKPVIPVGKDDDHLHERMERIV